MGDVIRDGVILAASEFTIIILYIVLSGPVATLFTALFNAGASAGVTQMASYQSEIFTVTTICFILLGFAPIIWFIVRMMSREPDWGYRYY